MGIDTKIYLENATTERVFQVIRKIVGNAHHQEYLIEKKGRIGKTYESEISSSNEPSSKENSWHVTFKEDIKPQIMDCNFFYLAFKDIANNDHRIALFIDSEDDVYAKNGDKKLYPYVSAFYCALGKRLIDFFGGRMLYSDAEDPECEDNWYVKKEGKVNLFDRSVDVDINYYIYQNALFNEPLITAQEILDMQSKAPLKERDQILCDYLLKYEAMKKIEQGVNSIPCTYNQEKSKNKL